MLTRNGNGVKQQPLPVVESESQLPPFAVAVEALKRSAELSMAAAVITCGSGLAPPTCMEKFIWPERLSKNAPEATTDRVTGTVIDRPGLANSVRMISPV